MYESPDISPDNSFRPIVSSSFLVSQDQLPSRRQSARSKTVLKQITNKELEDTHHNGIKPDYDGDGDGEEDYFKQDPEGPEKEEEEPEKVIKRLQRRRHNNSYDTYFKHRVFGKFLLIHLLYFFCLGPFIIILQPIFGRNLLYNLGFVGFTSTNLLQTSHWASVVLYFTIYYGTETVGLEFIEVYMVVLNILLAILMMSSKYAYQSDSALKLIHTTTLNYADRTHDSVFTRWKSQTDEIIEEEVQSAILRLEIDSSLFFFKFLSKIEGDLRKKLEKCNPPGRLAVLAAKSYRPEKDTSSVVYQTRDEEALVLQKIAQEIRPEEISFQNKTEREKDIEILQENNNEGSATERKLRRSVRSNESIIPQNAQEIMNSFAYFLDKKKLEENHLYGYNLMVDMMRHARETRPKYFGRIIFVVSFIRALLPTFYRIYEIKVENKDIPLFTDKPYLIVIMFLGNMMFYHLNTVTLSISIIDLRSKIYCLKQLGFLISPKKISYLRERKLYPTFNIFDPVTIKTWCSLRKVINEYGRKYTLRSNFNVTVIVIFYLVVIAILVVQLLGIVTAYSNRLLMIVFEFESVLALIIFLFMLLQGAYINSQYMIHKNLLKKNKTIISDFSRLSYLYVGKDAIEPDNYIYKEGLKLLRCELGEENFEEKLIARSEKLVSMIDEIIEDLDFEERNEPFTVLGIPITYSLLKAIGVAVVSVLFAVSQSILNRSN